MPKGKPKDRTAIIERVCPLPQNAYIIKRDEKEHNQPRKLDLLLANRDILDTCPVNSLDDWAIQMWNEYNLRKEFGDMANLPEIMFKAFTIILMEQLKCDQWNEKDRTREAENDRLKRDRGIR